MGHPSASPPLGPRPTCTAPLPTTQPTTPEKLGASGLSRRRLALAGAGARWQAGVGALSPRRSSGCVGTHCTSHRATWHWHHQMYGRPGASDARRRLAWLQQLPPLQQQPGGLEGGQAVQPGPRGRCAACCLTRGARGGAWGMSRGGSWLSSGQQSDWLASAWGAQRPGGTAAARAGAHGEPQQWQQQQWQQQQPHHRPGPSPATLSQRQ